MFGSLALESLQFYQEPFFILAVGIITVLGLILILRVNAFLALIAAAFTVSLLAPGSIETKISRVADSFGSTAGNIAIVIGLAAIIGECMMASGAADRIVQMFVGIMGQKRASWALMGSGFVLSVPVFFDTVFYLLVPLARSLFRRTNKNYLLYILAISAGGAITHTLVPPTPGPLVMAATLGVDVGVMILVGAMVALPAAVAGLMTSYLLDSWMTIPFRDDRVIGTEDDVPEVPTEHPPLWLSLLPVVLPVVLISANTALSTIANGERAARLQVNDITDWSTFRAGLQNSVEASPAGRLLSLVPEETHSLLTQDAPLSDEEKSQVIDSLNKLLGQKSPALFENQAFDSVTRKAWKIESDLGNNELAAGDKAVLNSEQLLGKLIQADYTSLKLYERERVSRTALEVAFPGIVKPHVWDTPARKAADISAVFGNANFALFLSTIIALYLLFRQSHVTLESLSKTTELALMSGGTIILITAAGGAFGAMLKLAGIGDAIKDQFASGGGAETGMMFILLGYGIAALMKVAQGSSTAAMVVVSGIIASMIGDINLGFHPVYLATAIGAGSLMGSWMNDSGFWIFTKMGRLTESESLRSWTIMLGVLSIVSLGMTVLLATVFPMV